MVKSKLTINCDSWLLEEAKGYQINFSRTMEEALQHKLNFMKGDVAGINIQSAKLELERTEKKLTTYQSKVSVLRETIGRWNELQQQKEEERLKNQKAKIEAINKCLQCGNILTDKFKKHKFTKGYVCNSCFMSADSDMIKRWK